MNQYSVDLPAIQKRFEKQVNQWVKLAGLKADILEERHIRISLPLGTMHPNHVGTAYAGSLFVLAEVAGVYALMVTFGLDTYIPIVGSASIRYLKPATTDCHVELNISELEMASLIAPIEERGKGRVPLRLTVYDAEEVAVCEAEIIYYFIPAT